MSAGDAKGKIQIRIFGHYGVRGSGSILFQQSAGFFAQYLGEYPVEPVA